MLCLIGSCNQGEVGVSPKLVSEPYTTEDLSNVRNGVTFLTPPTTALWFDFFQPKGKLSSFFSVLLTVLVLTQGPSAGSCRAASSY